MKNFERARKAGRNEKEVGEERAIIKHPKS